MVSHAAKVVPFCSLDGIRRPFGRMKLLMYQGAIAPYLAALWPCLNIFLGRSASRSGSGWRRSERGKGMAINSHTEPARSLEQKTALPRRRVQEFPIFGTGSL